MTSLAADPAQPAPEIRCALDALHAVADSLLPRVCRALPRSAPAAGAAATLPFPALQDLYNAAQNIVQASTTLCPAPGMRADLGAQLAAAANDLRACYLALQQSQGALAPTTAAQLDALVNAELSRTGAAPHPATDTLFGTPAHEDHRDDGDDDSNARAEKAV